MPTFNIINDESEFEYYNNYSDSVKFNSKDKIVDEKGQVVGEDFEGRKYRLISKKEREYSSLELIGRGLIGIIAIIFSLGYAQPHVQYLFKKTETIRLAIPLPSQPHIPPIDEFNKSLLQQLQHLWHINNQTLMGIIAKKDIPKFGFHGTPMNGVEDILNSRTSGREGCEDHIWVAGYSYQLDPITFLADLYTSANKAYSYAYSENGGGIFTVLTENAREYKNIYHGNTGSHQFPSNKFDTQTQKLFIKLIYRNHIGDDTEKSVNREDLENFEEKKEINSSCLFPAVEQWLTFNPDNFKQRVKGVLKDDQRIYSHKQTDEAFRSFQSRAPLSYSQIQNANIRLEFYTRFATQEIIFDAFEKLGVIHDDDLTHNWKTYLSCGAELMNQIDKVTKVTQEQLKKLGVWI